MSLDLLETSAITREHETSRSRRVLLIAYNFPPVGGAGVQRPVKWSKYLGRNNWDVTVLTTENPSVPVRDESLLQDVPDDVTIVRARTWEPDYRVKQDLVAGSTSTRSGLVSRAKSTAKGLAKRMAKLVLQPDPQVLWNSNALRVGRHILSETPHDAILVTAPAYSSFLIGAALKREFKLPLILDYRDEWDISGKYLENAQRDWYSQWIQGRMQRSLLKQADAVVATTMASTSNLASKLLELKREATPAVCIYNGFDSEDFQASEEPSASLESTRSNQTKLDADTFRLVYTGTLWNLTDIAPLVSAINSLHARKPELLRRLELVCVGRKTPEQQAVLNGLLETQTRLRCIDYCSHTEVLDWLHSADGVCLLLSDVPGAERVVPAKLFEYLAIRKEMLAIAPHGETADIVRRFFPSGHFIPNDHAGMSAWLEKRLENRTHSLHQRQQSGNPINLASIDEFSRASQTKRLAGLLDSLVIGRK